MQAQKIYSVLPKDLTYFEQLTKDLHCVYLPQIHQGTGSQSITNALKYRFPLKYLGKQAEHLIVLCIPAKEHQLSESIKSQNHYPLFIKTNKETQIKGYKSGKRSALFQINNRLLRYKGCGNDGDGFVYENNQLRGSHFFHTAKRELFMTNLVNQALEKETGESSANQPLFFYQFPQNLQHLGLKNDIKLLNKYCCVFETKGDRRVGTHLISPLEILFLNAFEPNTISLEQFFKKKQRLDEFGLTELLIDFQLVLEKEQSFLQKYDEGKQFSNYVGLSEVKQFGELKQRENFAEIVSRISNKFIKQEQIDLNTFLTNKQNWLQIIEVLLQKLGWEMGLYKRIFCQYGINWGFFNDHNMWHCNAHLNNFIIKKPTLTSHFILPLDFDLAFTKEEYINIELDSERYGQQDLDTFEQFLLSEYNAMEISVSGVQIMNFSYSIDLQQNQSEPTLLLKMMRIIFRDTLIKSFRQGMRRNLNELERINKKWKQKIEPITKLVESCLHIAAQFQT